jgi:hypothetical protein
MVITFVILDTTGNSAYNAPRGGVGSRIGGGISGSTTSAASRPFQVGYNSNNNGAPQNQFSGGTIRGNMP